MYVTQQGDKITHIVYRLALEAVLEQVPHPTVLLIIMEYIARRNRLDHLAHPPLLLTQQQVNVVRHQAVGVDVAGRLAITGTGSLIGLVQIKQPVPVIASRLATSTPTV